MPRDRDGTFEPKTVRKYQRRLHGVDAMVISLTAKGLTTGEVQAHLAEVYGTDLSRETMGLTSGDAARIKDLEAEVRELRRANEILRRASAFFASVSS